MRFAKVPKRVLSLSMAAAVAATTVAVPVVDHRRQMQQASIPHIFASHQRVSMVLQLTIMMQTALRAYLMAQRAIRRLPVLRLRMLHSRKVNSNLPYLYPVRT